jgi:hypothetical protein
MGADSGATERRFKGGRARAFSTDSLSDAADFCPIRVAPSAQKICLTRPAARDNFASFLN